MLKFYPLALICCLLLSVSGYAQSRHHHNKIDDISSDSEVESLLRGIDARYAAYSVHDTLKFSINYYRKLYDSLHIRRWEKADLDQNGYTDLVVLTSKGSLYIMDQGKDKLFVLPLQFSFLGAAGLPRVVHDKKADHVQYIALADERITKRAAIIDTTFTVIAKDLVYKYGGFIEYNPLPQKVKLKSIILASTPGQLGDFYNFTLDSARMASYNSQAVRHKADTIRCKVDRKHFRYIKKMASYICTTTEQSTYSTFTAQQSAGHIHISYELARSRKALSYGFADSYGMVRLYTTLMALRENQKWK